MKFGTDGVRGVAYSELTAEFATDLGRAAARVLARANSTSQVAIGGDTRESTPMLDAALCAGFVAEGIDVVRLGVAPTPMIAFEAQRLGALGAVVSASHNPFADNGIKLFAAGGVKLRDDIEREIEAELGLLGPSSAEPGVVKTAVDRERYGAHVLSWAEGRARHCQWRSVRGRARSPASIRRRGCGDRR